MPLEKLTYERVEYKFEGSKKAIKADGLDFKTFGKILGFVVPDQNIKNLDGTTTPTHSEVFMSITSGNIVITSDVDLETLKRISTPNGGFIPFPEQYKAEAKEISFTSPATKTGTFFIYLVGAEIC